MEIRKNYFKGSEWRKWDLHIHSKYSKENNTKLEIKTIFENAIKNEIKMISITDHSNVDSLPEVIETYEKGSFIDETGTKKYYKEYLEYLPGIELKTNAGKGTHLIAIFPKYIDNDLVTKDYLRDQFLAPLGLTENKIIKAGDGDYGKGLLKSTVDFEKACKKVRELSGVIIIHSGGKPGSIEKCLAHAKNQTPEEIYNSLGELKQIYMREYIDICEISSLNSSEKKNKNFYLEVFNKPTIISSDSHERYEGKKFTWIKGDLNINGLKQVINEPENRVSLEDPHKKIAYNIIDKVRFIGENNNFSNEWIEINEDLNTIIGGKSSGKSLLLYLIARTILKKDKMIEKEMDYDLVKLGIKDFEVKWKDGQSDFLSKESKSAKNITYIPQLYLNNIIEKNKSELDKTILKIVLENNVLRKNYDKFEIEKRERENKINKDIKSFLQKLIQKEENEEKLSNLPSKEMIENEIKRLEFENEIIQSGSALSDNEKEKYTELKEEINVLNEEIKKIDENVKKMEDFSFEIKNYKAIVENFNEKIDKKLKELDIPLKDKITEKLNKFYKNIENFFSDYSVLEKEVDTKNLSFKDIKLKKIEHNKENLVSFEMKLKEIDKVKENENRIKKEKDKLNDRLENEKKIENIDLEIKENIESIRKELTLLKQDYEKMKNDFLEYKDITKNLELDIQICFDSSKFEEGLEQIIDRRQSFDKIFKNYFEENKYIFRYENIEDNMLELINIVIKEKDNLKLKKGCKYFDLIEKFVKNYFYFNYDLKQNNDTLSSMSQGKRGLILFQLYLQFSSAEFPILIDQPEDNLDNRTVYKELKDFIIKKKTERQILMVTHNANLAVSTDSEEVIVANQKGENGKSENFRYRFEYVSGALENSFIDLNKEGILYQKGIKEHVCEILEGGEEAFRKRNMKYKIIKEEVKKDIKN